GTTWTNITTLTGTIAAGGYYLIQQAAGSGGTVDLPTPDDIGSIAMSGTNGKVALVNTTTALTGSDPSEHASVVDFVGYGSANGFEGTAAASVLTNTTSARRITLVDTNDNATDFHAVTADLSYLAD
ncbi:MAG: hypothetical protein IH571_00715, partial [Acholeplasmataceae bacterium]|nr:hypothetical protein [Acholeplasmataceae bacterium]